MAKDKDPGYQAFRLLQITFIIAPIWAGLDKFLNVLTQWTKYLSPFVMQQLHDRSAGFMIFVGIVEIIAGLGVLFKPKYFAYIISLWLILIIVNLLLTGQYYDIALRDLGLLLSSVALGRLSSKYAS